MRHKKQAYDQIERTIQWNLDRGNTPSTLNWDLETDMLKEELDELVAAETDTDRFDALLDLKFVINGTLGKMGLTSDDAVTGYELVLQANNKKTASKDMNGKLTKPEDFEGPEMGLMKILAMKGL